MRINRFIDGVEIKESVYRNTYTTIYLCVDGKERKVSNYENRYPYPKFMSSIKTKEDKKMLRQPQTIADYKDIFKNEFNCSGNYLAKKVVKLVEKHTPFNMWKRIVFAVWFNVEVDAVEFKYGNRGTTYHNGHTDYTYGYNVHLKDGTIEEVFVLENNTGYVFNF